MSLLGLVAALFGLVLVISRAPLVLAPRATLDWWERRIRSDTLLRGIGALLAVLGVALIWLSREERGVVGALALLGAYSGLVALWLLASPRSYRRVANGWLSFFRSSVDPAVVRGLGLLTVGLGLALIYAGWFVL